MRAAALTCLALAALAALADAQPAHKIRIGIYAPSVEFGTAQARLSYVQGLARAIEQATGIKTEAQSYANVRALEKDSVDFAIIEAQCYATHLGWKLLATATISGGATRTWALYSSAGPDMKALRGKKLAYINTGCNDAGFIDNAMLESEVEAGFFGARVGKLDLAAAVAEVASYKTADAVFAPTGAAKDLTKVFDTGVVPNPGFVDLSGKLPASVVEKVAGAVTSFGGGGAIAGWGRPAREAYVTLANRLGRAVKAGVLAAPEPVRLDLREVLAEPASLDEPALVDVRHHVVRLPGARME
jgi:hypothetical protein